MNEQNKLRHLAKCIRDDADKRALELEQIADGLERRAETERHNSSSDDDTRINQVRMVYGGFVPSVFKIRKLTGCHYEQAKRVRAKLIEFFGEGKAETVAALEDERRQQASMDEVPAFVRFDERPEVKAVVAQLTETLAGTLGTIAQSLADGDREREARLRASNIGVPRLDLNV